MRCFSFKIIWAWWRKRWYGMISIPMDPYGDFSPNENVCMRLGRLVGLICSRTEPSECRSMLNDINVQLWWCRCLALLSMWFRLSWWHLRIGLIGRTRSAVGFRKHSGWLQWTASHPCCRLRSSNMPHSSIYLCGSALFNSPWRIYTLRFLGDAIVSLEECLKCFKFGKNGKNLKHHS